MKSTCIKTLAFFLLCASCMESTSTEDELRATTGPENENCQNGDGKFYRGRVATTKLGQTCKNWSKSWQNTKKNQEVYGLGDHNYCRDPDGAGAVWCYAATGSPRWEFCDVPVCRDPSSLFASARSSSMKKLANYGPQFSIDGFISENNENFFHSIQENYPWLEIKLRTPTKVSDVIIVNRKKCCGERLKNAVIRAGMSQVPGGTANQLLTINDVCGTYQGPAKTGATIIIVCTQPIMAQYITIQLENRATLQVNEVRINYDDTTKKNYLALKNDGSREYIKAVKQWLPILLEVDALDEGEVGVAFDVTNPKENYPLALLTGEGIVTDRVAKKSFEINGTVNRWIGKRPYYEAIYRPVGLYAKPGDIITITIPEELVGKINAKLGQDRHSMEFELDKVTQKIGSPWGGLILIVLRDSDATTKHGQFNVEIENAIQAPYFVYSEDSNEVWNKMKHNAAPWSVLRIPGQVQIYIQSLHVKTETDMKNVLKGWKETMDMLDDLLGIPLNIQPGEERLHFDPKVGGGLRWNTCNGGGKSAVGEYYYPQFLRDNCPVVYHEWGHGYCYSDLPGMGGQWTAEIVTEYIERRKPGLPEINSRSFKLGDPFNVLYRMVSFSKMSHGEACGKAKFPDSSKTSYEVDSYDNCWTYLYRLPLFEFGWDILKQVLSTDATLTTKYDKKTDRMADLYCKATKHNLIPIFEFYNIEVSKAVKEPCEKQKMPDLITKYIDIANCIMEEDIEECTKLPGFPAHKGLCILDGVCNSNPDYGGDTTFMNNEFDLWGSTLDKAYKKGARETAQDEKACLKRASEVFGWCGNDQSQNITATFTPIIGDPKSRMAPPQGPCNGENDGCCTTDHPCKEADGDCDYNSHCLGDLKCGNNNCLWGDNDDCCYKPGGPCNGQNDGCCTKEHPCKEADGDCDNNDECEADLKCGSDNCPWGDNDDCCYKP